jgi:class 3 adenylate cyclase/tetratricopeptide (TPR) repeat protein
MPEACVHDSEGIARPTEGRIATLLRSTRGLFLTCSNCSTSNPDGAAFCMKCGQSLTVACSSCGTELPAGAAFCPTCGTPTASDETATDDGLKRFIPPELLSKLEFAATSGGMDGERRTVTMLFCDLQGSTAAAEQMDPEEWADVMNGAFEHLIAPVYRYEGTLARLMGDAILAFFGAPIGHEDDPERAVRAGLEILKAIEPYKAQVKRDWGIDIDVRVGINTGLVVVGAVGSDLRVEYTAMGDAVNTAARMESSAAPGTIQITGDTKQLIEKLFEFEDLGGVDVKGKSEPVQTFRVIKALPRPDTLRGIDGLTSPLVGRDQDLDKALEAIRRTNSGTGGVVSFIAEAGLGKSRLVSEIRTQITSESDVQWHEGRSLSYEMATPYASVRRMLESICGLEGGESPAEAWRRVDATVSAALPGRAAAATPLIAWLLDVEPPTDERHRTDYLEPAEVRSQAFRAAVELIEAIAASSPVVLVFEDLHWADPASLDFARDLLASATRSRLVLLLLFRPRRDEGSWEIHEAANRDYAHLYTPIELAPLTDEQMRLLIANLLNVDKLPETVRAEILDKSDGNPFFVEEIIRWLIDQELVVHNGEAWTALDAVANVQVPDTLGAVLTTRLDGLEERSRHVAQAASVVGRRFRYDELAAGVGELTGLDEALLDLQRRELIIEEARIPKRLFKFRHALLQEAAYETVLLKQRIKLHASIADFLERTQPERVEDLAEHLVRAKEPTRALPYLVSAGERALRAYAIPVARSRLEQAVSLLGDDAPIDLVKRAYEGLGTAKEALYDFDGATEVYAELGQVGDQRDAPELKLSSLNKGGFLRSIFYDRDDGLADLASAETLARELNLQEALAESCVNQCKVRTARAEFDEVNFYMTELQNIGEALGAAEPTLFGMSHHANSLIYLTQFDEALPLAEKALAKAEELGNLQFQADVLTFALPACHLHNGDVASATAALERGMEIALRIGARGAEAFAAVFQGKLAMEHGYLEDALGLFRRTIEASDATGIPYVMALGRCVTGTCYLQIGGPLTEQALSLHRETLDMMEQPTGTVLGAWMWTEIGQCVLAAGQVDEARELFEKALTEQTAPMYLQRPSALAGVIKIALLDGDLATAQQRLAELEEYVTSRDMKDHQMMLMYTQAAVAAGGGDHQAALDTLHPMVEAAEEYGMRRILLDIHVARAANYQAMNRPEDASTAKAAARKVADSMAGDISDGTLRSSFEEGIGNRLA